MNYQRLCAPVCTRPLLSCALALSAILTGCGGGGGDTSPALAPTSTAAAAAITDGSDARLAAALSARAGATPSSTLADAAGSSRMKPMAAQDATVYPSQLFDWAQRLLPAMLPVGSVTRTVDVGGQLAIYRYYPSSRVYLAALGGEVFGLFNNGTQTVRYGALADFAPAVRAGLAAPIPVLPSSYENKIAAGEVLGSQTLPVVPQVQRNFSYAANLLVGNAVAYADFFQEGSYSMFGHTLEYDIPSVFNKGSPDVKGRIYFFRKQGGAWVDHTAELIDDPAGCLHTRKAIVADFNGDGRPDVFANCSGPDFGGWGGEDSLLLLSQPNGKYAKSFIKGNYFHSSSAADINGDGAPDIAAGACGYSDAETGFYNRRCTGLEVFLNDGQGNFTSVPGRVPLMTKYQALTTLEFIKFDGRPVYDLFVGGNEFGDVTDVNTKVILNNGRGIFDKGTTLPTAKGFNSTMDAIYRNGYLYLLKVPANGSFNAQGQYVNDENFYQGSLVQKIAYPSLATNNVLYERTKVPYRNGVSWINWMQFYQGRIVSQDADFELDVPQ